MWSKQREIAESVRDNRYTAVRSSHDTGKSHGASRIVSWWLDTHDDPFGTTTAPTTKQVHAILWRYIAQAHRKGQLPGRITLDDEWYMGPGGKELVAFGRKPADTDQAAFQGIHALNPLIVIDEACHDDQTEVMTEFGWRRFKELDGSERLLTMDPDTHEAAYVRPQKLVAKAYSGPTYEYAATGGNFCVTPDHDLYWHGRSHNRNTHWRKTRADQSISRIDRYMMKSIKWNVPDVPHHVIPELILERKRFAAMRVEMDDWMTFLGWYCSEGSVIRRPDGPRGIVISQRSQANMDEIEAVVQRLGFTYRRYEHDIRIGSTQLAQHLALLGRGCLQKAPPTYARMASARQIGLFLDAFAKGDGYRKGMGEIIYTSSPAMADALQEMILKTGVASVVRRRTLAGVKSQLRTHVATSTVDGFVVTRPDHSSELKVRAGRIKIVDYEGMIYCASVPPNALLFTRRNGYTLWSGSCGVPKSIFDAVDALATNSNARALAIGNPDDPSSHFAQICKPGSGWHVITVSAFDTPAYTGEKVPEELLPLLVSPEWVEERKIRWGVTSPIYQSKVLGEFPDISDDSLILPRWIEAAQKRTLERTRRPIIAADIARFGEDETVIMRREGGWIRVYRGHHKDDTMTTAGHIAKAMRDIDDEAGKNDWVRAIVDVPGVGGGVVDRLAELDLPVMPYNGGEAPIDKAMTTLWSCLNPKCPPTDIAPKEVEEPGEERSDEPDQILTTQDVAELLKVPLNTIYKWNKSGTGPPFYMIGKGIRYRMGHVQRWWAEQDGGLAVCSSQCGRTYPRSA